MTKEIESSLAEVNQKIRGALARSDTPDRAVNLVLVSKVFPAATVEAAIRAGHRRFGENRVQEAQEKWPPLREKYDGLHVSLIGPLQSNKVRDAVALFDCIQTVDRKKIARRIAMAMQESGRSPELFIQVNTGGEAQKAGVLPGDLPGLLDYCRRDQGLAIAGLMCIPPVDEEASLHFALLRKLAREAGLERLSMGMSSDYELAVEMGATDVRVGRAVFGPRPS